MKAKKLLYITPAFPIGGLEKLLVLIANSLYPEFSQQTVVSLSTDNVVQVEFDEQIRFIAYPRKTRFDVVPLLNLRRLIIKDKPDSIICLNFFAFLFGRLALCFSGSGARIIVIYQTTIHGTKKEHLLHKFYISLLRRKDIVIAASINQVKYTMDHFAIPHKAIKLIYNGIDLDFWKIPFNGWDRSAFRKMHFIPDNSKLIIIAAAFRPEKNHLGAIRALKILRYVYHEDAYLLLVGDGIMRAQAEALTSALDLSEFVKFAGSQKELRSFYWASDLFSLTSASVETFSIAALEGMSCGLPAVLTDIGGAREMIVEGENGFLSESDDESLAKNWKKALNTNFNAGRISSMIAGKFDAKLMVKEYKNILNETA